MKKTSILLLLLLLGGLGMPVPKATGQSAATNVLATGGGVAPGDKIQLAWTLGEPIIQTAGTVTQGFHSSEIQALSNTSSPVTGYLVQVFPNPVDQKITLKFKGEQPRTALRATIWNALSQRVIVTELAAQSADYTLDCTALVSGLYWLELRDQQGTALPPIAFAKK